MAFLLTAVTVVAALGAGAWVGVIQLAPDASRAAVWPDLIVSFVAAHFGLPGLAASFIVVPLLPVFALGEEVGWRDYLLPRLLPLGERNALLISGAIWAAWHLPYNLVIGYNGGAAGFPLFALYAVLFGAILGRVRLRSGSIWPAAILHAAAAYQPEVSLAVIVVARPGFVPSAWVAVWQYATAMLAGLAAIAAAKSRS